MHRDLKILQDYKISVAEIAFENDAMGHRVSKLEKTATGEEKKTLYSLDAQGNTMATYHYTKSSTGLESLSMGEWTIYGSKRIGIEQGRGVEFNPIKKINNTYVGHNIWDEAEWEEIPVEVYPPWQIGTWDEPNQVIGQKYEHSEGDKRYELANHLGNVLNVVTDRKLPVDIPLTANSPQGDGIVDYFTADVVSYSDYLPFGQVMPNRHGYTGTKYRYGFQDQEVDDELKGEDNSVNFEFRMHDPRIGRFFAVDPLTSNYPYWGPYAFSGNQVIHMIELEGLEPSKTKQTGDCEGCDVEKLEDGDYFSDVQDQKYEVTFGNVSKETFEKVKKQMGYDPGKIVNNELAEYKLVDRDGSNGVTVGDHFDIDIADNGSVVVTGIVDTEKSLIVTVATLEGHPDAGVNTFSLTYDEKTKQMTWSTHNVSRTNDAASAGIVAGFIDAGGLQQQQWENVMLRVYKFAGKPKVISASATVVEYDYNDYTNQIGKKESAWTRTMNHIFKK